MDDKIKNILSLYQQLSENKKIISEIMVTPSSVSYSKLKFAPRTKSDQINKALLDDIETAAKAAGVDVTIDFAKTGHNKLAKSGNVSRHWINSAVDIDYIGGKVVSPANKEIVNKFVDALISMGYNKNAEGKSNPKAVLTFGFPGHDNHVHVSNTTDTTSQVGSDYQSTETPDETNTDTSTEKENDQSGGKEKEKPGIGDEIVGNFIDKLATAVGLKEERIYGSFGKNIQSVGPSYLISKNSNTKIFSPSFGRVNNSRIRTSCKNQVTIDHDIDGRKYHLQFCGISIPNVRDGQKISKGDLLGKTSEDVVVTLYNDNWEKMNLAKFSQKEGKEKSSTEKITTKTKDGLPAKKPITPYTSKSGFQDFSVDVLGSVLSYPFRAYDRMKRKKKEKENEKIQENIKRIKRLLK